MHAVCFSDTLLCKATKELGMKSPLTIYAPHSVESLKFSSYSTLFYESPGLLRSTVTLFHPILLWLDVRVLTPKLCFQHLKMTASMTASCCLLTPRADLQEVPIDNPDLIWFTDGSSLKDEQGHYLFHMQ